MNYFEVLGFPISFVLDEAALKRAFYKNSKKYHPDFYTLESEERQTEILELSTLNNKAYHTLSDFDKRMKYILDQKRIMGEEGQNKLPQDFLMEMMDLNEALMELQFDPNPSQQEQLKKQIKEIEVSLFQSIESIIQNYDDKNPNQKELLTLKDYYLKKRYLLRIYENLDKFAAH